MADLTANLLSFGQQVLQQQDGGAEGTVCFAVVPILLPAAVIIASAIGRRARRLRPHQG